MENKAKGKHYLVFGMILEPVGIAVTVISIIVTIISIRLARRNHRPSSKLRGL